MKSCYICCRDTYSMSPCNCKDLPACQYCIQTLIHKYGHTRCTVCTKQYPKCVIKYRIRSWFFMIMILYLFKCSSHSSHTHRLLQNVPTHISHLLFYIPSSVLVQMPYRACLDYPQNPAPSCTLYIDQLCPVLDMTSLSRGGCRSTVPHTVCIFHLSSQVFWANTCAANLSLR
mgnify:CR=1 FL=1